MSALADLGWEAYPNEGVSICLNTHTHTHNKNHPLFMPDLAPKVWFYEMFYFLGNSQELSSSTGECVLKRALGSWALLAKSGVCRGNLQIISAVLKMLWHWSLHLLRVAILGTGLRGKYSYVRGRGVYMLVLSACVYFMCVCVCGLHNWPFAGRGTKGVWSAATMHQKIDNRGMRGEEESASLERKHDVMHSIKK